MLTAPVVVVTATIVTITVSKTPSYRCAIYGYFLEDFETDVMCSMLQASFISNCYAKCSFFRDRLLRVPMVAEQESKAYLRVL